MGVVDVGNLFTPQQRSQEAGGGLGSLADAIKARRDQEMEGERLGLFRAQIDQRNRAMQAEEKGQRVQTILNQWKYANPQQREQLVPLLDEEFGIDLEDRMLLQRGIPAQQRVDDLDRAIKYVEKATKGVGIDVSIAEAESVMAETASSVYDRWFNDPRLLSSSERLAGAKGDMEALAPLREVTKGALDVETHGLKAEKTTAEQAVRTANREGAVGRRQRAQRVFDTYFTEGFKASSEEQQRVREDFLALKQEAEEKGNEVRIVGDEPSGRVSAEAMQQLINESGEVAGMLTGGGNAGKRAQKRAAKLVEQGKLPEVAGVQAAVEEVGPERALELPDYDAADKAGFARNLVARVKALRGMGMPEDEESAAVLNLLRDSGVEFAADGKPADEELMALVFEALKAEGLAGE